MNEFETLDNDLSSDGFSEHLLSLAKAVGLWAKIVAIINIGVQSLNLIVTLITVGDIPGAGIAITTSIIVVGVVITLYVFLLRFAQKMDEFSKDSSENTLAQAMFRQRVYWQYLGILMIICLFFILVGLAAIGDKWGMLFQQMQF